MSELVVGIVWMVAVVVGVFGYLIREKHSMELIAGYDAEKTYDEEGLATVIGTGLYVIALLTVLTGGIDYFGFDRIWIVYTVVLVIVTSAMIYVSKSYELK